MSRMALYSINDRGWVVPERKAYRKARYRRKMGRYSDFHSFHKNKDRHVGGEVE